jgi:prevent-host-death family protein
MFDQPSAMLSKHTSSSRTQENEPKPDQEAARPGSAAVSTSCWRDSNILRRVHRGLGDRAQIGGDNMAAAVRKTRIKEVPLSEIKDDLSRFLREAEKQEIVITRHGEPAGVLIGFESEDDWFDYKLENDPRFLERIEQARRSLKAGRGIRLEDVPK